MDRKSFVLYTESKKLIEKLNTEQKAALITAIFDYADGLPVKGLDPLTEIVFITISSYMDKDMQKYETKCQKNRENAAKRWQSNVNENKGIQLQTIAEDSAQAKEKELKNVRTRQSRFTPPKVEEVQQYIESEGFEINAAEFIDYYEARGWELSKGRKVKDWRACVRTWAKNTKKWGSETQKANKGNGVTISAVQRSEYADFGAMFGE